MRRDAYPYLHTDTDTKKDRDRERWIDSNTMRERKVNLLPRTFQVRSRGCVFCALSQARQATFLQPTYEEMRKGGRDGGMVDMRG